MKATTIFCVLLLIAIASCNKATLNEVAEQVNLYNHQIFEENKLPPRATFFALESAAIEEKENSRRYIDLNGEWNFNFVKNPKQRPTTFQNSDFDDSDWKTIPVPANWEVEGYDYPIYLDERYPLDTHWPDAPTDYNPVGTNRKKIVLTAAFLSEGYYPSLRRRQVGPIRLCERQLDIPMGISTDANLPMFKADQVLTLAAPKDLLNRLPFETVIYIADIGLPLSIYKKFGIPMPKFYAHQII